MGTKTIALQVADDYELHPWFVTASPKDVGIVLNLLANVKALLMDSDMMGDIADVCKKSQEDAVARLCNEMTRRAQEDFVKERGRLDESIQKHQQEKEALQQENARIAKELALAERAAEAEAIRLKDVCNLKMEQSVEQYHTETLSTKALYQQLQTDVSCKIMAARQEERMQAADREQQLRHASNAAYESLQAAKTESDNCLMRAITDKANLVQQFTKAAADRDTEVLSLTKQIEQLKNPYARGSTGEVNVADVLKDVGFLVEDTSKGNKNPGYLDLLVSPESAFQSSQKQIKIAVEVKNKKDIKMASLEKVKRGEKDINDDIRTFQIRAKDGIAKGLYDAAVFVSLRAHTHMGAPVVLEMFEDITGKPLAPVSYLGSEKGKGATHLTRDQLETHIHMMFGILEQCANLQVQMSSEGASASDETLRLQMLFEETASSLNDAFAEMQKQEGFIKEMTGSLNNTRQRCIAMSRSISRVNMQTPWLKRKIESEWMPVYSLALERSASMSESDVWNRMQPKQKSMVERNIGKDAMFAAIREEKSQKKLDSLSDDSEDSVETKGKKIWTEAALTDQ